MQTEVTDSNAGEFDAKYLPGFHNRIIRYYFYLNSGLTVLNNFRNLFLGIIALYIALKLDNVGWLIAMFVPCILALTMVGYYAVHRMSKVTEWLNIRFSTHYALKQFNYQQKQFELLGEIRDLLRK